MIRDIIVGALIGLLGWAVLGPRDGTKITTPTPVSPTPVVQGFVQPAILQPKPVINQAPGEQQLAQQMAQPAVIQQVIVQQQPIATEPAVEPERAPRQGSDEITGQTGIVGSHEPGRTDQRNSNP